MTTFLAAPTETCEVCAEKVSRLYPLTRHDGKHFRPVRACRSCLGPNEYDHNMTRIDFRAAHRRGRLDEMLTLRKRS